MLEENSAVYGNTNTNTLNQVRDDFLHRKGLDLPLFYFDFIQLGKIKAEQVPSTQEDKPWTTAAVMRHGVKGTHAFYVFWQEWAKNVKENDKIRLFSKLLYWAEEKEYASVNNLGKEIILYLLKTPNSANLQLANAWKNLQENEVPFHYHLPFSIWNGSNNIYHQWLSNLIIGELGFSNQDQTPVLEKIKAAFQVSSSLALAGLITALFLSFLGSLYLSQNPTSVFTQVCQKFLYLLDSIPGFLIALGIFAIYLSLGGTLSFYLYGEATESLFQHFLNPSVLLGSVCIALLVTPHLTLQFVQGLLEQKSKLYFRTALGKGYSYKKAMRKHALPNTLVPTITLLSEVIISLVAGVLVVEITFSLPGIGSLFTDSIINGDYPVMVGLTLLLLVFRLGVVWLSELAFVFIDPRMKNNL
ncbi:ABC transporter permease [Rufibacter tibetensis]|nr:ABC transporter permease [Rufibacter tibetensis]